MIALGQPNEKGKGHTAPESYSASRLVVYDVMVAHFSTVLAACLTRLSPCLNRVLSQTFLQTTIPLYVGLEEGISVGKCGGSSRVLRNTCQCTWRPPPLRLLALVLGSCKHYFGDAICATFERLTTKLAGVSRILLSAVLSLLLFTHLIVKAMRWKIFALRSS